MSAVVLTQKLKFLVAFKKTPKFSNIRTVFTVAFNLVILISKTTLDTATITIYRKSIILIF